MRQPKPSTMIDVAYHVRTSCARWGSSWRALAVLMLLPVAANPAWADTYRSANFIVTASSSGVARQVAEVAEDYRRTFAYEWLGVDPGDWESPCQITVEEQPTGGQGWVSYERFRGRAEKLRIRVQGQLDQIAEYVLPHEVAHAVLAASIGRPLPRWADEGVALLCEPESQQVRQRRRAAELVETDAVMPLCEMLRLVDYPDERQNLIAFYTSSFSLSEYLVARGGKQRLLYFVRDGERDGWDESVRRYYGTDLQDLEAAWKSWVPVTQQAASALHMNIATVTPSSAAGPSN